MKIITFIKTYITVTNLLLRLIFKTIFRKITVILLHEKHLTLAAEFDQILIMNLTKWTYGIPILYSTIPTYTLLTIQASKTVLNNFFRFLEWQPLRLRAVVIALTNWESEFDKLEFKRAVVTWHKESFDYSNCFI